MAPGKSEILNPKSGGNPKTKIRKVDGFKLRIFLHPVGRSPKVLWFWFSSFLLLLVLASCDKPVSPATQPTTPTIASLVPAATDLIAGMGAGDQIVAISTYDKPRKDVGARPIAGDYQTIDWEQLRSLHPSVLVTEMAPSRQPAGFTANAQEIGITPVNVTIENLSDIYATIDQLGDAIKQPALAKAAHQKMQARLDAVQTRCAGLAPVRTLIVSNSEATDVIGPGTYVDDLLKLAGGTNVVPPDLGHWPSIDREKLLSLSPDVVLQLLPGASPQDREQAAAVWKQMPDLPAVKSGRVYTITDDYALLPGWHVTDLAEQFADCLHVKKKTDHE